MAQATQLTQPPVPLVRRHNKVPLYLAGCVVLVLAAAYVLALATHAKKQVEEVFHETFTTTAPLYKAASPPVARVTEAPPAPPPAPPKTEQSQENPWTKQLRENQLKWSQMLWDHQFKLAESHFEAALKLAAQRREEQIAALRASSLVNINGQSSPQVKDIPSMIDHSAARSPAHTDGLGAPSLQPSPTALAQHVTTASLVPPVSPFLLKQGTHLPVVLDQWLNSDAQDAWTARISADVYDSLSSRHLLIPAGSTLFGFSEVELENNQQPTLMLAARTLQLPNGSSLDLGRTCSQGHVLCESAAFAQNGQGVQGLSDQVNRHLWQRYGSAVVLSLITAGIRMAAYSSPFTSGFYLSPADAAAQGSGEVLGRAAGEDLRRTMSIRPTVTVPLGYRFNVTLTQDTAFPGPYRPQEDQ